MSVERELAARVRCGTRVLFLRSSEEQRALEMCDRLAAQLDLECYTVTAAESDTRSGSWIEPCARGEGLCVVLDPEEALRSAATRRALRNHAQGQRGHVILLVGERPETLGVPELEDVTLALAGRAEVLALVTRILDTLAAAGMDVGALRGAADAIAELGLGLPLAVFERRVREAMQRSTDPTAVLDRLRSAKAETFASAVLTPVRPIAADRLGGLEHYKAWLQRRALALRPDAAAAGIPLPRGVLLLGVQGCGKSLAAKHAADALGLPLVRLDPGALFSAELGGTESNLRRALGELERLAPVCVWIDEVDKTLNAHTGARSDGGTASRALGTLLTWLQERTQPVFVAITANRIEELPPELLRRGRLDETFFVDLPDASTRAAILAVHMRPDDPDPDAFAAVARAADEFSGAELEAALIEARLAAFEASRPMTATDFEDAVGRTIPLARTYRESVAALRAWARDRARTA